MNNTEAEEGQAGLQTWGTPSNPLGAQGAHDLGVWHQQMQTRQTRTRSQKNGGRKAQAFIETALPLRLGHPGGSTLFPCR